MEARVRNAVSHYWATLSRQSRAQGKRGSADTGNRKSITGGRQMDGFTRLIREVLEFSGVSSGSIYDGSDLAIPGFYRPTKEWDLVVVHEGRLLVAIELKSQAGPSFGNNFNNRAEEAIGTAVDARDAHRYTAYGKGSQPWFGWLMLLEDTSKSRAAVRSPEPHFPVRPEFAATSYADRYAILFQKLRAEKRLDGAAFLLAPRGTQGLYTEPESDLSLRLFLMSLSAHVRVQLSK
ncbi:MAG: restriction endonuclease [Deltaproteobacteria bacterium]|nr:restriction endonuclease [Deltaproteobacteria bacterium]